MRWGGSNGLLFIKSLKTISQTTTHSVVGMVLFKALSMKSTKISPIVGEFMNSRQKHADDLHLRIADIAHLAELSFVRQW